MILIRRNIFKSGLRYSCLGLILVLWLLLDHLQHGCLHFFSFQGKSVFIPNEIRCLGVETMSLHAALKETNDVGVVWVLGEGEASAVVHVLLKLIWVAFT